MSRLDRVPFGDLKIGDVFSISARRNSPYWNMKVKNSRVIDGVIFHEPFNGIDLSNGQPRTFRDVEMVAVRNLKKVIEDSLNLDE